MSTISLAPILVPVDFSGSTETTLGHAIILSKQMGVPIVLLHAIETHFSGFNLAELALHSDSRENAIYDMVELRLKKRVKQLEEIGVPADFRIEFGSVHKTAAQVAIEIKAGYIVVGAHGQSGFEEYLIGSNSFRLCATAPCPVITVQQNADQHNHPYKNVVLPVDTSFYTRQKVKSIADLAEAFGATVHIFGVSSEEDADSVHHVQVIMKQVKEYLGSRGIPVATNEEYGANPTDATIVFAKAIHADLIAIMTEQEPSIQSLIMGEYAQQMINRSPIPVISFRPHEVSDHTAFSL
jgi:nucleotide-binding universal stress UspA family protein